jgi:hypothetical protein
MSKVNAGKAAIELRKLADALALNPEAIIEQPYVSFYSFDKASFVAVAKLLPRPLKKSVDDLDDEKYRRIRVRYGNDAIDVQASVAQSLICELIEPAKPAVYRCDPILSLDEIDEVAR